MDAVLDGFETELVGGAVNVAAFRAAAGEPHREAVVVVVAAGGGVDFLALRKFDRRGAAEFAAPDDEGVVEEAALFEIGEEGGEALAAFVGEAAVAFLNVVVAVPRLERTVPDLDVAHAALYEAAGNEHLFRLRGIAVERANGGGFAVDVEGVGRSGLHPKRCLETLDARLEGGVGAGGLVAAVEGGGEVELRALGGGVEVGVGEMVDEVGGFAVLRFDVSALVGAGEEG